MQSTRKLLFLILITLSLRLPVLHAQAQTPQPAEVGFSAPAKGDALQGVIPILGTTAVEGFKEAEIAYAYADNPTDTWFPLARTTNPVLSGALATWDTTTITDGDYVLRLNVFLQDGSLKTARVAGLRVRNYSPVETSQPTATLVVTAQTTPIPPTRTPAPTLPLPTPTALPPNPARVTLQVVNSSLIQGGLAAAAVFVGLGLYLAFRALFRRF